MSYWGAPQGGRARIFKEERDGFFPRGRRAEGERDQPADEAPAGAATGCARLVVRRLRRDVRRYRVRRRRRRDVLATLRGHRGPLVHISVLVIPLDGCR